MQASSERNVKYKRLNQTEEQLDTKMLNNSNLRLNYSKPTYSVLLLAILFMASCAQGPGGGSVGGVVIDSPTKMLEAFIVGKVSHNGVGIPGAKLEVKGFGVFGETDENGEFKLHFKGMTKLGVTRKRVQVQASAQGYRTRTRGVYVEQNRESSLTIELLPRNN